MVLAYLLLHPRAGCSKSYQLNSYSQNELESGKSGIEGEMETREESAEGSWWLDRGAEGRTKGERANICPSASWILAPLPSHYSLRSDWITYNQHQTFLNSISCTRNRVFSRFFCVMKPLWEVRGLYSARSPRDGSVFVLHADVYERARLQSLHRNCFLSLSLFLKEILEQIYLQTDFFKSNWYFGFYRFNLLTERFFFYKKTFFCRTH